MSTLTLAEAATEVRLEACLILGTRLARARAVSNSSEEALSGVPVSGPRPRAACVYLTQAPAQIP